MLRSKANPLHLNTITWDFSRQVKEKHRLYIIIILYDLDNRENIYFELSNMMLSEHLSSNECKHFRAVCDRFQNILAQIDSNIDKR